MKISKVLMAILTMSAIVLSACGTTPGSSDPSSQSSIAQYTITFNANGGSSVSSVVYDDGTQAAKPTDPTKANYIFDGWYYDSALTNKVTWPFEVTESVTLYAKWTELRAYFLTARDATVNSNQFEYDFNLNVATIVSSIEGPSATIDGNIQYNESSTPSYLATEYRSGLLIGDGKVYRLKSGTTLDTYKLNADNKLSNYIQETVGTVFKYESSSFAKALFEFNNDQITAVTDIGSGTYQLQFSGSFTGLIENAMGFLNHPFVNAIISIWVELPTKDANLQSYVTFEDGKIKTYSYDFTISVSLGTLAFHYDLDFTHVGSGVSITAPSFPGHSLTPTEIQNRLNEITANLTSYRNLVYSGYDYRVDTEVDYPGKLAINSTTQGRTMRKIDGGVNYFWNRVKFDSDYKNNDLYNSNGIVDYERYRVKYANQDVYDVTDGFISNTYSKIDGYNNGALDAFYMLLPNNFFVTSNFSAIQTTTESTVKTYSMSINQTGLEQLIGLVDQSVRTDLNNVHEFNIFNGLVDLNAKNAKFDLIFTNNALTSIIIDIDGNYSGAYTGTVFSGPLDFELKLELNTNDLGNNYTVPTKNSEVDLSNT